MTLSLRAMSHGHVWRPVGVGRTGRSASRRPHRAVWASRARLSGNGAPTLSPVTPGHRPFRNAHSLGRPLSSAATRPAVASSLVGDAPAGKSSRGIVHVCGAGVPEASQRTHYRAAAVRARPCRWETAGVNLPARVGFSFGLCELLRNGSAVPRFEPFPDPPSLSGGCQCPQSSTEDRPVQRQCSRPCSATTGCM
jgi:hypothetical protein